MDLFGLAEMVKSGGSVADTSQLREIFRDRNTSSVMERIGKDAFRSEKQRQSDQKTQDAARQEKVLEKVMRTVIREQTEHLDQIDARKPVMLVLPDGKVQEAYFTSQGKTVKIKNNNNL